jgi:hypothetical protein
VVHDDTKLAEHYCQARTWGQDRAGGWGNSRIGCARAATGQDKDGHWACTQHLNKPPACGWNYR